MHFDFKARSRRRRTVAALVGGGVLSVGAVAGVLPSLGATASATARKAAPVLQAINVPKYPGVLGNSKSRSLYVLADEAGGKLHCTGQCLQFWFPVYVKKGSHPSRSAGVKGKIGMVARKLSKTLTKYQVTDNGYPLYTFAGDTGPKQSNGEHVKFATGVYWYLVSASAKTPGKTPVKKASATGSMLQDINVASYPGVLGNSKQFSLYILSDEAGGKLHCTGGCLGFWFPLYVAKGAHASVGAGVKGKIGTVARKLSKTVTKYQVTFNSYPVYVYSGDAGARESNGEGFQFASGVYWYLASASATTPSSTPVLPVGGGY